MGYVNSVEDGEVTDLRTFALQCARDMGALIMMRDEPIGAEIPKQFEPDLRYHTEALARAEQRLAELSCMTEKAKEAARDAEWQKRVDDKARYEAKARIEYDRVKAMHDKVSAWEGAPDGLKEYMLSQLNQSLDREPFLMSLTMGEKPSVRDWYRNAFDSAIEEFGQAHKSIAAEKARTAGRNAWLAQLWAALPE